MEEPTTEKVSMLSKLGASNILPSPHGRTKTTYLLSYMNTVKIKDVYMYAHDFDVVANFGSEGLLLPVLATLVIQIL